MTTSQPDSGTATPRAPSSRAPALRRPRLSRHAWHSLLLLLLILLTQLLAACNGARTQGEAGGINLQPSDSANVAGETLPVAVDLAATAAAALPANALPPGANQPPVPVPSPVAYVRADGVQIAALPARLPGGKAPAALSSLPVAAPVAAQALETTLLADTAAPAQPPAAVDAAVEPAPAVTEQAAANIIPVSLNDTTNVLVLGSDRRVGTPNWRTDVMMIVALDETNGRAGVISIPRDIFIDVIPGHAANKINVLDYLGERDQPDGGGPELIKSILAEKMGIRIDHWVRFDFTGFVELVDALGGVEIEIDCPYYDYFQIEDVILNVKPGLERLTGEEALVYVRSRKIGGDLDRARRQQRFIWAIRNQVLNENILVKLPALYNAVSDTVQTDLGVVGTIKIARMAIGLDREDITGFVIGYPLVDQGWAGNMWVFLADWEAIQTEVQHVFDREPFLNTNTLVECP